MPRELGAAFKGMQTKSRRDASGGRAKSFQVSYNLLQNGAKTLTLAGHGHWVNTLALSAEYALRTGAYDHTAKAPASDDEGQQVSIPGTGAALHEGLQC